GRAGRLSDTCPRAGDPAPGQVRVGLASYEKALYYRPSTDRPVGRCGRPDRGVSIQTGLPISNPAYEDLEWRIEVQAENSRNHRFDAARLLQNGTHPQWGPCK